MRLLLNCYHKVDDESDSISVWIVSVWCLPNSLRVALASFLQLRQRHRRVQGWSGNIRFIPKSLQPYVCLLSPLSSISRSLQSHRLADPYVTSLGGTTSRLLEAVASLGWLFVLLSTPAACRPNYHNDITSATSMPASITRSLPWNF